MNAVARQALQTFTYLLCVTYRLYTVFVLVPRCNVSVCLYTRTRTAHTHRINFQANERCLWCSVIKVTSILYSIPFHFVLLNSFRFFSLLFIPILFALLLFIKRIQINVVKGFNNYWCVHLLNVHKCMFLYTVGIDWTLSWQKMASWAHWKWKNFMWILWCFHLHFGECDHWGFGFVGDRPSSRYTDAYDKCTYITISFLFSKVRVSSPFHFRSVYSIKLKSKLKLTEWHENGYASKLNTSS